MAWFGLDTLLLGVDLDAEQRRSDELDAQILAANQELVNRSIWTQEQADAALLNITAGNQSTGAADVVGSVNEEFQAGLQEGLDNVTSGIHDTLAGTISAIFRSIPLMLWVLAAAALFVYLGGLDFLRRRLAKA